MNAGFQKQRLAFILSRSAIQLSLCERVCVVIAITWINSRSTASDKGRHSRAAGDRRKRAMNGLHALAVKRPGKRVGEGRAPVNKAADFGRKLRWKRVPATNGITTAPELMHWGCGAFEANTLTGNVADLLPVFRPRIT